MSVFQSASKSVSISGLYEVSTASQITFSFTPLSCNHLINVSIVRGYMVARTERCWTAVSSKSVAATERQIFSVFLSTASVMKYV